MTESPLTSPDLWNELHENYERTLAPLFSKVARRGIELLAPGSHSRALDVACGPGTLTLDLAPNDRSGNWKINVHELASGIQTSKTFQVQLP